MEVWPCSVIRRSHSMRPVALNAARTRSSSAHERAARTHSQPASAARLFIVLVCRYSGIFVEGAHSTPPQLGVFGSEHSVSSASSSVCVRTFDLLGVQCTRSRSVSVCVVSRSDFRADTIARASERLRLTEYIAAAFPCRSSGLFPDFRPRTFLIASCVGLWRPIIASTFRHFARAQRQRTLLSCDKLEWQSQIIEPDPMTAILVEQFQANVLHGTV